MEASIRSLILCLALSAFFAGRLGCTAIDTRPPGEHEPITPTPIEEAMFEDMTENIVPTNIGASMLEKLGTQDALTGGHMMGDTPLKEPEMSPADRDYLEKQCTSCHPLERVFWTRGPRSTWEKVLGQEAHREIGLEAQNKEQLYKIFQQYLSKP